MTTHLEEVVKERKMSRHEVEQAIRKVMVWDFGNGGEELLAEITRGICDGKSVVVDAVSYIGNGRYVKEGTKDRYQYKMFVPFVDKRGNIYSTDLFKGSKENAIKATYEIYTCTRQWVIKVVDVIDTDYSLNRFGHGYTPDDWGIERIVSHKQQELLQAKELLK